MKDLFHNIKVTQLYKPTNTTAAQNSTEIDMRGFGSLAIVFAVGTSGDTLSGVLKWTLKLQHSDASGSGFTDVAVADMHNTYAAFDVDSAAKAQSQYSFGYNGNKRYVRAVLTSTGTHANGTPIAILAVQGHAGAMPVV